MNELMAIPRMSVSQFKKFKKDLNVLVRIGITEEEAIYMLLKAYERIREAQRPNEPHYIGKVR